MGPIILIVFVSGVVVGALMTWNAYIKSHGKTELWFFPDQKLPCYSYYGYLGKCKFSRCSLKNCNYYHYGDLEESSLMKIINTMVDAEQIDLCMYKFTLTHFGNLFINLKKRGTRIRIITDTSTNSTENIGNQIPRLKENNIEVRERDNAVDIDDRSRPLMHNKFVIVDNKCCLLGSFNWTRAGVLNNQESVIKTYDTNIVSTLIVKFNQMWSELER